MCKYNGGTCIILEWRCVFIIISEIYFWKRYDCAFQKIYRIQKVNNLLYI
jgi:hypothetical protein